MTRKSDGIAIFTDGELSVLRQNGEIGSDWAKAARDGIADGSDPDDAMAEGAWATIELPMPRTKVHASIRLDADVLLWFKAQGKGYQTRINAVLRSYFQQHAR